MPERIIMLGQIQIGNKDQGVDILIMWVLKMKMKNISKQIWTPVSPASLGLP